MSSRLWVNNLPKHLTEKRFKEHFEKMGVVTDTKIMKTKDGHSRQFGFIGYSDVEDAKKALNYFNNTFIDTSKIQISIAKPYGDQNLGKPWSKHSQTKIEEKNQKDKKNEKKDKDDPNKFVLKIDPNAISRKRKKFDDQGNLIDDESENTEEQEKKKRFLNLFGKSTTEDSKDSKEFVKVKTTKKRPIWANDDEFIEQSIQQQHQQKPINEENKEEEEEEELKEENNEEPEEEKHEEIEDEKEEELESGRLFIRNLSYMVTEDDLNQLFETYGIVNEVHLPVDRSTTKPKGFAYVQYMIPSDAIKARNELDGKTFQGRLLHILPAKAPPTPRQAEGEDGNDSFKSKKLDQMKKQSGNDFNWNSLFIRHDTALEAVSASHGVEKSDVMDIEESSGSLAVRLALTETQAIKETKNFLQQQGVDLEALERGLTNKGIKRSKTIILVKNIPYDTSEIEIRSLFSKFGTLIRAVVADNRCLSIVEFSAESEGRKAFKSLAYTRFKNLPLFLEWAPVSTFSSSAPSLNKNSSKQNSRIIKKEDPINNLQQKEKAKAIQEIQEQEQDTNEEQTGPTTTLFVKNLNFKTSDKDLRSHILSFSPHSKLRSVTIAKKKVMSGDKKTESTSSNALKSLGYGFVEFSSKQEALDIIRKLQGTLLDGHSLEWKLSQSVANQQSEKKRKTVNTDMPATTKIVVRNLAFEATKQELFKLFSAFGEIRTIRIPKKFDGSHRGFAFVEFLTKQEAQNAFKSLQSTHLYGRHLVLEYSKDDQSNEDT